MINLTCNIYRNKEIHAADIDGDKVMMDLEKGKYYAMNAVGSFIWDMIEEERNVEDIIEDLLNEFEITRETCEETVLRFLNGLEDEGLIKAS